MRRLIVVILAFLTLAVPGPAGAGSLGPVLQQAQDVEQPAVVIEEDEEAPKELAWTFRFLVPILWLLTALLLWLLIVTGLLTQLSVRDLFVFHLLLL